MSHSILSQELRMLELEVIPEHGLVSDVVEFILGKLVLKLDWNRLLKIGNLSKNTEATTKRPRNFSRSFGGLVV